jgi:hypothetical protein
MQIIDSSTKNFKTTYQTSLVLGTLLAIILSVVGSITIYRLNKVLKTWSGAGIKILVIVGIVFFTLAVKGFLDIRYYSKKFGQCDQANPPTNSGYVRSMPAFGSTVLVFFIYFY